MIRILVSIAIATVVVRSAGAQAPVTGSRSVTAIGTWRGTSLCLVRPSACHDEVVVYRITARPGRDSVTMDARKIVDGQEEEMGVLACGVTSAASTAVDVTCPIPNAVWRFHVRGDSLVGELLRRDSTKFRDVRARRGGS